MSVMEGKRQRVTVTLMLTHQCNLNCVYCYEKNKSPNRVMSFHMMKNIVSSSFDKYKDHFKEIVFDFMGGEPLLEFVAIQKLVEWTWSKKWPMPYLFYATTNGTLMSKEKQEWFSRYKERFVLGLSYDGTPDVQDSNRSFSSKMVPVDYFIKTWPFQSIKMTISPDTINQLQDSIVYLHENGVDNIFANLAYGVEWEPVHLSIYKDQLARLVDYYAERPHVKRVSLLNMNLVSILLEKSIKKYCGAGEGMVFHDFDGQEYPCHLLSPINLDEDDLRAIKDLDYCDSEAFAPSECMRCLLYNICPSCCGMNYLYLHSFKKRFPFMCRAMKIQVAQNMLLQYRLLRNKPELSVDEKSIIIAIKKLKQFKLIRQCLN